MVDVADSADPTAWEPLPSYMELLQKTAISVHYFSFNSSNCYSFREDWDFGKKLMMELPRSQVLLILAIMATLTVMRALMSAWIFEPLSRWLRLTPSEAAKFPESAWKLLVYSILWTFSFEVVVISARHDYLQRPSRIWNFTPTADHYSEPLPGDIYWMYILQISFYLHSIYATLYMDVWRKDSMTMLFHHGITLFLLQFSFLVRYHKIGSLVLFIHDISDVFLEFTKINVYLKRRGRRFHMVNDVLSSLGFVAFAGSWAFFRLYWFPLKVLYSSTWGVYLNQKGTKGPRLFFHLNLMLWLLLALHIYWFWFILVLLYRIATGQLKELDDTREYDSGAGSSGDESSGELASKEKAAGNKSKSTQNGSIRHRRERSRGEANGFVMHTTPESDGLRHRQPTAVANGSVMTNGHVDDANGMVNGDSVEEVANGMVNGDSVEEIANGMVNGDSVEEVANGMVNGDSVEEVTVTPRGSPEKKLVNGGTGDNEVVVNGTANEDIVVNGNGGFNGNCSEEDEDEDRGHLLNGSANHSKE